MEDKTTDKQAIIHETVLLIEKGLIYTEIVAVICGKFRFSNRTFDKYWKLAKEEHNRLVEQRKKILEEENIKSAQKAAQKTFLARDNKLEYLEEIIKGEPINMTFFDNGKPKHTQGYPNVYARMRAIELHNRMQGDDAPTPPPPQGGSINNLIINGGSGGIGVHNMPKEIEDEFERFINAVENITQTVHTPDTSEQTG